MTRAMFKPKERRIYRWNDGEKDRRSDPLQIELGMTKTLGVKWRALHKPIQRYAEYFPLRDTLGIHLCDQLAVDSMEAQNKYISGVRVAFGLGNPCDPEDDSKPGFDSNQCMALMTDFLLFMGELEEQTRPLPNSPPSTDSGATVLPMPNLSDSTPTAETA